MEITTELLPWDSEDCAIWSGFLQTVTGRRLIPKILESVPHLLGGGETNDILVRSGELRGYSQAVRTFLDLQTPVKVPAPEKTNYPSPENDAGWEDGQTLNPNPKN